jgi:hypothetical protein
MADELTAMRPEQVDLLAALDRLRRNIPALAQRVVLGTVSPAEWITFTDLLSDLRGLCRAQAIIEGDGLNDPCGH